MNHKNMVIILFCIFMIFFLTACADVAMTGAQAFYNRHSWEKNINDQLITLRAYRAIHVEDDRFKDTNIAIATYNGEVLLAGQAPKQWQRIQVEQKIKDIPNVKHIYNLVSIENPSSGIKRASDAWITAKVKAKFIASNDLDATQIKVVTENGTVYLMGILPPTEADAAIDIASTTDGVQRVVKIFSYVHINKSYV